MTKKLVLLSALIFTSLSVANLTTGIAAAQAVAGQGALAGVVLDGTKAAIPGAKVVLDNPGIGYHKETVTNGSGEYIFSPLTVVGGYTVTVTAKGFSTGAAKGIETSVGTVVSQNFTLNVGSEATTIEVQAAAVEQVQTDTSSVSQLIDSQVFQNSPLSVRDPNSFVGMVAGAADDTAGTGRGYAVNGARTGTGNFELDGFDNNDQGLGGGAHGGSVTTLSPDAVQEYRVITSVPNAEYGRAGGFTTDTVLKSGTKTWHGSAFEYNRIQALAQEGWFNGTTTPHLRDHLIRNQFGGSIGGPVYKDRTFFYATAEFQRQDQGSPASYEGITQDFYNFVNSGSYAKFLDGTLDNDFSGKVTNPEVPGGDGTVEQGICAAYLGKACAGSFAAASTLGPVFKSNYGATPGEFPFGTNNLSNEPTDLLLGGNFVTPSFLPVNIYGAGNFTESSVYNENRGTLKLDHKLTERDQLSFAYSLDLDNDTVNAGGGDAFPGPAELNYGGAQIFGATFTHTFTPNLINVFKAGYLRHVRNFAAAGPQGTASTLSFDSITTGFGKSEGFPQLFTENQFSYEDAVTLTKGKHTFKAGGRYSRTRNGSSFYNDVNGTYYYWGSGDELTDGHTTEIGNALIDCGFPAAPGCVPTAVAGGFTQSFGSLYYASGSLDLTTGMAPNPYRGYRANEVAAYVQDDFKLTSRLFVNYGIRWDYFGPPHNSVAGVDSDVYFGSATTVKATLNPFAPNVPLLLGEQNAYFACVAVACGTPGTAGYAPASPTSTIWKRDLNNFAPRLGFSYDAFGNGKVVLRGGFGIGYDRLYNNVYENIRFNGPHFVDNATGYGAGQAGISPTLRAAVVQNPFTANTALSVAGASPVPRHVNQNLVTAYYEQAHFGVETEKAGYVMEANYIGTFGRQLVGLMNANTFGGRTACSTAALQVNCKAAGITNFSSTRPDTAFGNDNFRTNGFSSNYNGLQLSVRKSYAHGFQTLLNYTYSKALDQISDVFTLKGGGTGIPTPYAQSANYGPSDFDLRHLANFTVNYISPAHGSHMMQLLTGGWGISPTIHMRSGDTVPVIDSAAAYDPNKDGTTGVDRAVYVGSGKPINAYNHSGSPAGLAGNGMFHTLNPALFKPYVCPKTVNSGLWCNVPGRNSLTGLRQYNVDAAISKHIALTEKFSLTLQAAFFDVDGHVEWSDPVGDINSPNFGKSLSTGLPREGQLAGRIDF